MSSTEIGDGVSSRVYLGTMKDKHVAIKKLKGYSNNQGALFVKSYEKFLYINDHPKVTKIYGLCPQTGCIVMELCEKKIEDQTVHTLEDLMIIYGDDMPLDLKVIALADIIEGIEFHHNNGVIHGDVKPSNVLVDGSEDDEFVFAKLIPDNPSRVKVKLAFDILAGSEAFTRLSESLPPPLCNVSTGEVDNVTWNRAQTWTEWWTRPKVLQKLSKAYSSISTDDWEELPATNNPVESINKVHQIMLNQFHYGLWWNTTILKIVDKQCYKLLQRLECLFHILQRNKGKKETSQAPRK